MDTLSISRNEKLKATIDRRYLSCGGHGYACVWFRPLSHCVIAVTLAIADVRTVDTHINTRDNHSTKQNDSEYDATTSTMA